MSILALLVACGIESVPPGATRVTHTYNNGLGMWLVSDETISVLCFETGAGLSCMPLKDAIVPPEETAP